LTVEELDVCPGSLEEETDYEVFFLAFVCVWSTSMYYHKKFFMNVELGQAYICHRLILHMHQYPEDEDRDGPWNVGFFAF
jgi:hypothetical protein